MESKARYHFPQIRFSSGKKELYNSILKKKFVNLPEERVRLAMVDYLLLEAGWNKNRIGFEAPIRLPQTKHPLRADLVLYDQKMNPYVIIECKSESVALNLSTAEQIARYNSSINAPYLMLTNGITDYWFSIDGKSVEQIDSPLNNIIKKDEFREDVNYWTERGFINPDSDEELKMQLSNFITKFWDINDNNLQSYFDLNPPMISYPIQNRYRIFELDDQQKLAITFLFDGISSTRLIGILNQSGENKGLVSVNLDEMFSGKKDSAVVYQQEKTKMIDARSILSFDFKSADSKSITKLKNEVINFFD
ncbi:MAG: type I restriction enzyme HsdR N-terminal domain-containing protein [Balneolaceae bacterium]